MCAKMSESRYIPCILILYKRLAFFLVTHSSSYLYGK